MKVVHLLVVVFIAASTGAVAAGPHAESTFTRHFAKVSYAQASSGKMPTSDGLIAEFWNLDMRTVVDRWIVETDYKVSEVDPPSEPLADRFAIDITHVRRLKNGMSWSMNGFVAQLLKRDSVRGKYDGADAEVSAGWFFRDNVGVGARLAVGDREGSGDFTRYEAFADYRLTDKASVGVSYVNERINDFDQKTSALMLGFTYRR
jgi:hypothetical protein